MTVRSSYLESSYHVQWVIIQYKYHKLLLVELTIPFIAVEEMMQPSTIIMKYYDFDFLLSRGATELINQF